MNDFVFQNTTKIYFGKDQLAHLGEEAAALGKKVLLVYGGGSIKRSGLYDKVVDILKNAGMTISELGGVEPNPHHTTVNKGVQICREEGIDVILLSAAARLSTLPRSWLPRSYPIRTIAGTSS